MESVLLFRKREERKHYKQSEEADIHNARRAQEALSQHQDTCASGLMNAQRHGRPNIQQQPQNRKRSEIAVSIRSLLSRTKEDESNKDLADLQSACLQRAETFIQISSGSDSHEVALTLPMSSAVAVMLL